MIRTRTFAVAWRVGYLAAILYALGANMGWSAVPRCDLALSLAIDASSSIQPAQHAMARKGTADALRDPDVAYALSEGTVYLQVYEWSDTITPLVEWTRISGPDGLARIADMVEAAPRSRGHAATTSLGPAMLHALAEFGRVNCSANVLDILTDGQPTGGITPEVARDRFDIEAHQVNVLFVGGSAPALARMEAGVRFGWGSFVMPLAGFEDVELGMRRKLIREVSMALQPRYAEARP